MTTFKEHADQVAAAAGVAPEEAATIIRAHLTQLTRSLAAGEKVVLTGYGTFVPVTAPITGAASVQFKPGATLTGALNPTAPARDGKKPKGKRKK